jgi:hypothetical protein
MQEIASNWLVISLILAVESLFGIGWAVLTRRTETKGPRGQRIWLAVFGIAITVAIALPRLGLETVGFLAAIFTAAGWPMIYEYLDRVNGEEREADEIEEKRLDNVGPRADR